MAKNLSASVMFGNYQKNHLMERYCLRQSAILLKAIKETYENRNAEIAAFSELNVELVESLDKQVQWTAFLKKSMLVAPADFGSVLTEIGNFLAPLLDAIMDEMEFDRVWGNGGPWRERHPGIL